MCMDINLKITLFLIFLAFNHTVLSWFNVCNLLLVQKLEGRESFVFFRIGNQEKPSFRLPENERKSMLACFKIV